MTKFATQTIGEFLADLASARPTPGGGCVAGLVGAFAAALGSMVGAIARKKSHPPELAAVTHNMNSLREEFLELADEDTAAFDAVMTAYRIPKDDPTRRVAIDDALAGAAAVPLHTAEKCVELLQGLNRLVPHATPQSVSDVGVAVRLAAAALESALLNVTINLAYMRDPARIAADKSRCEQLRAAGAHLAATGKAAVAERMP